MGFLKNKNVSASSGLNDEGPGLTEAETRLGTPAVRATLVHIRIFRTGLFGRFALRRRLSVIQCLEEAEETSSLAYSAKLDAERLHLDEQVLHIDDLVADQRLKKNAHQTH